MRLQRVLLASCLASCALAAPAKAVSFKLIDVGGTAVGTEARRGFEMAADYWSSVLTDDITITLNIGYVALSPGVLGGTSSTRLPVNLKTTYDALAVDATSALDTSAVANLQPLSTSTTGTYAGYEGVSFTSNVLNRQSTGYLDTGTRTDNDGSANNIALAMNLANAQALGITSDFNGAAIDYSAAAGSVYFSSSYTFDFDPTDGISAGSYDFIGVAIHEIGHALGFVSGVDYYDAYTYPGNLSNRTSGALENGAVNTTLDLFRYNAEDTLDLSTSSSNKYFSIDGGKTELFGESSFSTGVYNGDGRQASHWKDNVPGEPQEGILDPSVTAGQIMEVTALDLAAYDAMGWDISFDVLGNPDYKRTTAAIYASAVPEPATWLQMLLGFGLLAAVTRRRRSARAVIA